MLAVGRALMSDPKLLMLDEPSLGLAPTVVESMYETFGRLHREGLTILLAEQSIELALEVSDFATVLQVGKSVLVRHRGRAGQRSAGAEGLSRRLTRNGRRRDDGERTHERRQRHAVWRHHRQDRRRLEAMVAGSAETAGRRAQHPGGVVRRRRLFRFRLLRLADQDADHRSSSRPKACATPASTPPRCARPRARRC